MRTIIYSAIVIAGLLMASHQAATVTDILKHNKGVERLNDGQTEKALEVFSELLGKEAIPPETYYNLGGIFSEKGEHDKAIQAYQQALEGISETKKPSVLYNLGNTLFQKQSYKEAIAAYKQSLLLAPDFENAKKNLELALFKLQQQPPTQNQQKQDKENDDQDKSDKNQDQKNKDQQDEQAQQEEQNQKQKEQNQPEDQKEMQEWQAKQLLNSLEQKEKDALERYMKEKYKALKIDENTSAWNNASINEVQSNYFKNTESNDNLILIKGKVEDTLLNINNIPEKISLLKLDTSLYEGTKIELEVLSPKVQKGGMVIIEGYFKFMGVKKQ